MSDEVHPFRIDIPDADLDDLRARLGRTRFPDAEPVDDWSQGIPLTYVRELCTYWRERYDWRPVEAQLNTWPQYKTELDGVGVHFLHIRSPVADASPLVMTHGWPGSVIEFSKVIEPLTNPAAHGGTDADAFHLVLPTIPGYGFSDKPTTPGWGVDRVARAWSVLMARLGYARYFAQGGDWGSAITASIGVHDPEHCIGLHTNMAVVAPPAEMMAEPTAEEQDAIKARQFYMDSDSGYSRQQSTRPQTLGYGLVDSPAGQAAWIVEKFYQWMDCDGHPENVLTRDEILDNVMFYWLTAAGASSARLYWESFARGSMDDVNVPAGISVFPKEIFKTSRRWAETRFKDLRYFNRLDKGGHFAAFERPEAFVQELRACFATMR